MCCLGGHQGGDGPESETTGMPSLVLSCLVCPLERVSNLLAQPLDDDAGGRAFDDRRVLDHSATKHHAGNSAKCLCGVCYDKEDEGLDVLIVIYQRGKARVMCSAGYSDAFLDRRSAQFSRSSKSSIFVQIPLKLDQKCIHSIDIELVIPYFA